MRSVFVSSTFRDMQAERDALARIVLPDVAAEAARHQEDIEFIDLRWGVDTSELESVEGSRKVLSVCLDEIEHSRPYMIILLGERYGWVPERELMENTAGEKGFEISEDFESVTALEIRYGALSEDADLDKCLFYCREGIDVSRMSGDDAAAYGAESERHREKLEKLKKEISAKIGRPIPTYKAEWDERTHSVTGLEGFCEMVSSDLKALLRSEWEEAEERNEEERAIIGSWSFFERKAEECTSLDRLIADYKAKITDRGTSYFILKGESGCGKSTIMGRIAADLRDTNADVFPFVCGQSEQTATTTDLMRQLVYYLSGLLGHPYVAPEEDDTYSENDDTYTALTGRLAGLINEYSGKFPYRNLYIVIDAMEFLTGLGVERFGWVPAYLPDNVRIISCFTNDKNYDTPLTAQSRTVRCERTALTREEARNILRAAFERSHKQIREELIDKIVSFESSRSPLFLSLFANRLIMLDSRDFGRIAELGNNMDAINTYLGTKIDQTPDDVAGLCRQTMREAGEQINSIMTENVIMLIALTAHGLREKDLAALFSYIHRRFDKLSFARLMKYLRSFFIYGPDGRIDYSHRIIRSAVLEDIDRNKRIYLRSRLWEYVRSLPATDPVCADYRPELAWVTANNQDFINYFAGLDSEKEERAKRAMLTYFAGLTMATAGQIPEQVHKLVGDVPGCEGYAGFVRGMAKSLAPYYPKSANGHKALQWTYRDLSKYMDDLLSKGMASLSEMTDCRHTLIYSFLESGAHAEAEKLTRETLLTVERKYSQDPGANLAKAILHRDLAEHLLRSNVLSKSKPREAASHCREAEKYLRQVTGDIGFEMLKTMYIHCSALELQVDMAGFREKSLELVEYTEKFCRDHPDPQLLRNAYYNLGEACYQLARKKKMDKALIMQSSDAFDKCLRYGEEGVSTWRSFDDYLTLVTCYNSAAMSKLYEYAVCDESEIDRCLAEAKAILDKDRDIIFLIEKSIGSIQAKEKKYQYHSALYAYYILTGDDDAAAAEAAKGVAVMKELADSTGFRKYKSLVWLGDGAMFVPDRKRKSYFGVIRV